MQVEGPDILPDDVIRVIDDMAEVHRLQQNFGGWEDDMALVSVCVCVCVCLCRQCVCLEISLQ